MFICPFRSTPEKDVECTKKCALFSESTECCSFYNLAKSNSNLEDAMTHIANAIWNK